METAEKSVETEENTLETRGVSMETAGISVERIGKSAKIRGEMALAEWAIMTKANKMGAWPGSAGEGPNWVGTRLISSGR